MLRLPLLPLVLLGAVAGSISAWADDPAIPATCLSPNAADHSRRCADAIEKAYEIRTATRSKADAPENAALYAALLGHQTRTGETVQQVLDNWTKHSRLGPQSWTWVYSRSGARYLAMVWDVRTAKAPSKADTILSLGNLLDDDVTPEDQDSIRHLNADSVAVWGLADGKMVPVGNRAYMMELGSATFIWDANRQLGLTPDKGFDPAIRDDSSFLNTIRVGDSTLATYVSKQATYTLSMTNKGSGYVVSGDGLPCPSVIKGDFTLVAADCEQKSAGSAPVSGTVLPFKVIRAAKSRGFAAGVAGFVSVSVTGGTPADWLATVAYVSEQAITGGVTFVETSVFVENPWGDAPPQQAKILAKAYYAPDTSQSPWSEPWLIEASSKAPSLAEVAEDEYEEELTGKQPLNLDPGVRLDRAVAAAIRRTKAEFHLPASWKPTPFPGLDGTNHDRDAITINIADKVAVDADVATMQACLKKPGDNDLLSGCLP